MNGESAGYRMLPWLRQGLSTLDMALDGGARARVDVQVQVKRRAVGSNVSEDYDVPVQKVLLYGPGDVLGFNPSVVWRTEPKADVGNFEPNYFPFVEFIGREADFPWRFTAKPRDNENKVWPWLTLLVLKRDPSAEFESVPPVESGAGDKSKKLPPRIKVTKGVLPDLAEAWRWAHVQVEKTDDREPGEILTSAPERVVGRLLCARRLKAGTRYQAFLVPTFELGRVAGLGIPADGISAETFAWRLADMAEDDKIELPYYYAWQFGTGLRGDFEYLVRLLEPRALKGLGLRDVNCDKPGFGVSGVQCTLEDDSSSTSLGVEGALRSLDTEFTGWGKDKPGTDVPDLQTDLATLIGRPDADISTAPSQPPVVVPPIYGRWHAAKSSVSPTGTSWVDRLNLDPRHRMAAGLGAIVVEREQEALMASAWKQLGAVEEANKLLRQGQLGREASLEIHRRLAALPAGELLRVAQPVASRVIAPAQSGQPKRTVRGRIKESPIPLAAIAPAFRRIARLRGPLRRRQQAAPKGKFGDLLERLNRGEISAAGPAPKPDGMPGVCDITMKVLACDGAFKWARQACGKSGLDKARANFAKEFRLFCEENIDCALLLKSLQPPPGHELKDYEKKKRQESMAQAKVFCEILGILDKLPKDPPPYAPIDLAVLRNAVVEKIDPRKSIPARIWSRIKISANIRKRVDDLDQIMAAPDFPQPMYEPLSEMSQDHILPGLASIPQNTVGLLKSSPRFIQSYLAACSHAFAWELLWRGYPTDQRGTYFRQFWDVSEAIPTDAELDAVAPSAADIGAIRNAAMAELGENVDIEGEVAKRVEDEVKKRLAERRKDITPIHSWKDDLGKNDGRPADVPKEPLVLLIRGDLLKKYPDTVIYAVRGRYVTRKGKKRRVPELSEYNDLLDKLGVGAADESLRKDTIFSARLSPDITVLGFPLTENEVRGGENDPGYYFVIEQHVSRSRFGLDETDEGPVKEINDTGAPDAWDALSWGHFFPGANGAGSGYLNGTIPNPAAPARQDEWNSSAASIANITLQRPVRIAVHASKMIAG